MTFGSGLEALSAKLAAKAAKGRKRDTLFEDYMRRRRCLLPEIMHGHQLCTWHVHEHGLCLHACEPGRRMHKSM